MKNLNIGVIGMGTRGRHVGMYLRNMANSMKAATITFSAVCDTKEKDAVVNFAKADGYDVDVSNANFYTDVDEMLDKEQLDGVILATNCNTHTQLAVKVLERNIPLFLEKPVATNFEDYEKLKAAGEKSKSPVVVSHPLRLTPLVTESKRLIDLGEIGEIQYATGWCRVAYGGCYYHDWYRNQDIIGGLFLQKATHDFDYINYLIGKKPVKVCAMKSKQVMKGNKPAGLYCKDCDENFTCPEGQVRRKAVFGYAEENSMCCYAVDTGNEDSGSALVLYEDGMHLSYSQCFFIRNAASAGRGVYLAGTKGSLTFDWMTNKIILAKTYQNIVNEMTVTGEGAHGGGDDRLCENFVNILLGKDISHSTLQDGLNSANFCLKANLSAETGEFVTL